MGDSFCPLLLPSLTLFFQRPLLCLSVVYVYYFFCRFSPSSSCRSVTQISLFLSHSWDCPRKYSYTFSPFPSCVLLLTFLCYFSFLIRYSHPSLSFTHFFSSSHHSRVVSTDELFPLRAPFLSMEPCIGKFLELCDPNNDQQITLIEWGQCLDVPQGMSLCH